MSLLSVLQDLAAKKGQPTLSAVFGATDTHTAQLRALAKEAVGYLGIKPWQQEYSRIEVASPGGSDQGLLTTLFGAGFHTFDRGSLWDVDGQRQIHGPVDTENWQQLVSLGTGPEYRYRVMADHLWIWPEMTAGHLISVMVQTRWVVRSATGVAQATFLADTDTVCFPELVLMKEIEWRWLKEKGEPWTATFEEAKALTMTHLAAAGSAPVLRLDPAHPIARPTIYIPPGNW